MSADIHTPDYTVSADIHTPDYTVSVDIHTPDYTVSQSRRLQSESELYRKSVTLQLMQSRCNFEIKDDCFVMGHTLERMFKTRGTMKLSQEIFC